MTATTSRKAQFARYDPGRARPATPIRRGWHQAAVRHPLDERAFRALLRRLSPDSDADAGDEYLRLRRRLMALFRARMIRDAEDLADETLDRVSRRLVEGEDVLDLLRYCRAVAMHVAQEHWRTQQKYALASTVPAEDLSEAERLDGCLDRCLGRMPPDARRLLLDYHGAEGANQLSKRAELAIRLRISPNALRIRVHRLREVLRACVERCLETRDV
jgi:DNA-directed RNA polymerase specialized sigma24 family protein